LKGKKSFKLGGVSPPPSLDGYHTCPFGGGNDGNWGCSGKGGRRKFHTFITSKVGAYYEFFFKSIDDWVHYSFKNAANAQITSKAMTKGQGWYVPLWISAGQTVKLEYICDNYNSGYNCELLFPMKYWKGKVVNLMFFQTDPGSSYCGAPQHIIDRTTLRGTRERHKPLPHMDDEYRKT
tara:strand:+ start:1162 stop:1698 length:537 start_codon:yes stop_codon:yes gene_type:complete